MQNFDSLKDIWKQEQPQRGRNNSVFQFSDKSKNARMKLEKQLYAGAITLTATAVLLVAMALFWDFGFTHWFTYGAIILAALICASQAAIFYYTYHKVHKINEAAPPAEHLHQWEEYFAYRQRQVKINMPVYFITLNIAMGIYFYELFIGRPVVNVILFLAVYVGWMLFAIFYLGRKAQRRENERLQSILQELKNVEINLQKEENY
ncbi:MAG: hypothetical protein EOO04_12680 [Chitinophagaceae bacterium]|nr:MAG: hypothetical protein EOO04_12680 [Chitinophagaceae bacterium]